MHGFAPSSTPLPPTPVAEHLEPVALPLARMLLEHAASVDCPGPKGATPLYVACAEGHVSVVSLLLEHGADASACADGGRSPLAVIAEERSPRAVQLCRLLLEAKARPNDAKHNGIAPLFLACAGLARAGRLDGSTRELWRAHKAAEAEQAAVLAAEEGRKAAAAAEEERKAVGKQSDSTNGSPTSPPCAAASHEVVLVELLLEAGADVEMADSGGVRPLWIASHQGHREALSRLLQAGASVNARALDGTTALWAACMQGHACCVRALLGAGGDARIASCGGTTPRAVAEWQRRGAARMPPSTDPATCVVTEYDEVLALLDQDDNEVAGTGRGRRDEIEGRGQEAVAGSAAAAESTITAA